MLAAKTNRPPRHSAIYGLGGLVSRILAVLLLPLYTSYLTTADYGKIETLVAASTVLVIVLRLGISSAFFRFYFDSPDPERRVLVVRRSFWFTRASATAGLVAGLVLADPIAHALRLGDQPNLVRAAAVGLWAQMNYEQLTSLVRVEERSVAFVLASVANILITVGATVLLVVVAHKGPLGVLVGNFIDRFFVALYKGQSEVGVYSVAVRISSTVVFLLIAFRTAWPAFAYSIEDDREARRTYAFVLTYLLLIACWLSLALGLLSPWLVELLARKPGFHRASEAVATLCFAGAAYAGYTMIAIGICRARRTQFNWIVTGLGAGVNVVLNVILIPPYGMMGAAIATLAAYVVLFGAMTLNAQHVYPVPYQWRRIATLTAAAVGLTVLGKLLDVPLPGAIALALAYPFVLLVLGFYLPAERARLKRLVPSLR